MRSEFKSYSVPQDTLIGPKLFNILMNKVLKLISVSETIGFADETVHFYKSTSQRSLELTAEAELKQLLDHTVFTINMDDTRFIYFGIKSSINEPFDTLVNMEIRYF